MLFSNQIIPRLLIFGASLCSVPCVNAREAVPAVSVTPAEAVRTALARNPGIRVLEADVAAARGEVTSARAWQNPEITFTPGRKTTRDSEGTRGVVHGDFGLEQTIEWPGKRRLREALAEKAVGIRRLALDGFRAELAVQVRRACAGLLAAREIVRLREQKLDLARSFARAAAGKSAAGYAPEFETTKADVDVITAQKELRDAQADEEDARTELNTLMGRPPGDPLQLAARLDPAPGIPARAPLLARALERNPAILIQEATIEHAGIHVESVRKSRYPDFKVGPSAELTRDEQVIGFGVSLPLPLWDGKEGEIATATAEQRKETAELDRLRRGIAADIAVAYHRIAAARDALAFHTPELRARLKRARDAAEEGYHRGSTPILIYLEANRTWFDTEAAYFESLRKLHEARATLESACGFPLPESSAP